MYDTIHCGDTFRLLKEIEDASVDLIVCDGPYGITDEPGTGLPQFKNLISNSLNALHRNLRTVAHFIYLENRTALTL
ncbi:MAG: hypothetical protein OXN25_03435 [Candidatus Poribacteria bacterium]|nr:hypothetical protein [Candidatus Poribacteria bacterium]